MNIPIHDFFSSQLSRWPDVAERYRCLSSSTLRKEVKAFGFTFNINLLPGRKRSTLAKTDAGSIAARPCFLCPDARPGEQMSLPLPGGRYELLVNPYPIRRSHFTIPATGHVPQLLRNRETDMVELAVMLPETLIMYNGPRAGASAPDHFHFQGVPLPRDLSEIPILSTCWNPFLIYRDTSFNTADAAEKLRMNAEKCAADGCCLNAYAWFNNSAIVTVVVPRPKHRPDCFFTDEGPQVSPGALDMAGCFVTTTRRDFDLINTSSLESILSEVSIRF